MQYYNNILTVEANWLIEQGIMTTANYRNLTTRQDLRVVRRGCRGQEALVDYESMPERFKRKVDEIVKDPYKAVRYNMLAELINHSTEASEFFEGYMLADGRHLPADKRRQYYADAIVLNAIHELINKRAAKRRALGKVATRFWGEIAECVQELDVVRYPHALPANARSLERKYKAYKADGYEVLIHKAYLAEQKNAAKISDENQISMLAMLISDPRKLDDSQVASMYNAFAGQMQWKTISASAVAVWRGKLERDVYARRNGVRAYQNNKAMQIKRSAPNFPLYYWTMDGWDAELLYQKTENGRTTYHHRATVVVVLDACLKYPIGYAVGTHENPELIKAALRNAVRHTEELFGTMHRTAQLQSDNYAIGKLMPLYSVMADKVTPAAVGNAKAKIVEPWFKMLNKKYCQLALNWSGFGVTSRKELQPNSEYLNKFKASFPDYEGVCQQIANYMERERAELREQYVALYHEMPAENRFLMSKQQYLLAFGATTGKRNLLQGSGINLTIDGMRHSFDCFDPNFRKYASVRWEVRFDPEDMSTALAVNEDESLQFILESKYVQPMALIERSEGDYEQMRRVIDYNEAQAKEIITAIGGYQERAKGLIEDMPGATAELETLQKLLITDSRGQHKNQRNVARLKPMTDAVEIKEDSKHSIFDDY